jgi:hypothetical protein
LPEIERSSGELFRQAPGLEWIEQWLAGHPRRVFHFTPTSASWLNAVKGFFSINTRRKIRRGVFKSVAELEAIGRNIRDHNGQAKPFVWSKTAEVIFEKLSHLPAHNM